MCVWWGGTLVIQHAKRMRRTILFTYSLYHISLHYLINGRVSGKKIFFLHKICFFLYNIYLKQFPLYQESGEVLSQM